MYLAMHSAEQNTQLSPLYPIFNRALHKIQKMYIYHNYTITARDNALLKVKIEITLYVLLRSFLIIYKINIFGQMNS